MLLLNLQDARHPNQAADQKFHEYLKSYPCETFLLFNKIDKLKKQKERAALNKLKPALFAEYKWVKQIFFMSAESKQGCDAVEQSVINQMLLHFEREANQKT